MNDADEQQGDECEKMIAVIRRVRHYATGSCDMKPETRLKLIAKECDAALFFHT